MWDTWLLNFIRFLEYRQLKLPLLPVSFEACSHFRVVSNLLRSSADLSLEASKLRRDLWPFGARISRLVCGTNLKVAEAEDIFQPSWLRRYSYNVWAWETEMWLLARCVWQTGLSSHTALLRVAPFQSELFWFLSWLAKTPLFLPFWGHHKV